MSFSSFIRRDSAESVRSVIHNSDLHANLLGDDETDDEEPLKPFCRWVSTLRRRKKHQSTPSVTPRSERWMLDGFDDITSQHSLGIPPIACKVWLSFIVHPICCRRQVRDCHTSKRQHCASLKAGKQMAPYPQSKQHLIWLRSEALNRYSALSTRRSQQVTEQEAQRKAGGAHQDGRKLRRRSQGIVKCTVVDRWLDDALLTTQHRPTLHCLAIIIQTQPCVLHAHLPKRPSPRC